MPAVNGTDMAHNPPAAAKPKKANTVETIYQKKTQLEHILLRPDTYIGSVEYLKEPMWVYNDETNKFEQREVSFVPGLYKIFDEILVNAADNKQRDPGMDTIKIEIDPENNMVSVWNNGKGIPVVMHKDEKMYVPTMIFGHLLTSSNYNDEEQKVTGGRNGYGAKLCNIFSNKFIVETASDEYSLSFKQTWGNNMSKTSEPKVKAYDGKDFTKITFYPDLTKFKMESLDKDIVAIMSRRAYDIAASTRGVKVFLNGKKVPVKNFKDYVDLYIKDREDDMGQQIKCVYEQAGPRWEVAVALSDKGFQQMSFVNSIATTKGGRHTDYVTDMIVKAIVKSFEKNKKLGLTVKPFQIKSHIWVFINCLIVNPTFDSQTKENMTLMVKSFGSKCELSDKFMGSVLKCGITEAVTTWAKFKQDQQLKSKCTSKKQTKLKGIPKLEDANDAGGRFSSDCTLILTEGDSAKSLAVAGLGVVGRDRYGVFPLKGKVLNVREATHKQIMENAEINNLIKILGLQYKKQYNNADDIKTLRYGKLMIMTDQDQDGSHIKGLLINFLHHFWPSLLKHTFMEEFITPIVKATKGKESYSFYSLPEFEEWKKDKENWHTYKVKYYKGLGTSTSNEAKEYFNDMIRHRIKFNYTGQQDDHSIQMAFSKKHVEQRKEWLTTWMQECKRRKELGLPEVYLYEKNTRAVSYTDFVNKELVLFSNLDNERSIPCLVDGFKPGQRKVFFTCLKRNDKREVKVAQLAGSVAEHSAYHHGEASLMSTIINLAQNYVGSNNINLLQPIGQFGTRLQGGKDHASPRYIFTMLSKLARYIFHPHDEPLLKSNMEDNQRIEPEWYIPILPMVLVNGADGIGTGWSTKLYNYNPRDIVNNLKRMMRGEEQHKMHPWFKGYRGTIEYLEAQKYIVHGEIATLGDNNVEITELPIHKWTQTYKEGVLEAMVTGTEKAPPQLTNYKEYHTDTTVRFTASMSEDKYRKALDEGLHKTFKLTTSLSLASMVLFDHNGVLRKYENVDTIMKEFFDLRLTYYGKRKDYMVGMLQAEADKLSNQARFIIEKCDGRLVVENKKKKDMIADLQRKGYESDPVKAWKKRIDREAALEEEQQNLSDSEDEMEDTKGPDYDYLLGMAMWSLTKERKDELLKKKDEKVHELDVLKEKSPENLWTHDLDEFLAKLEEVEAQEIADALEADKKAGQGALKGKGAKKMKKECMPSPFGERVVPRIDAELKRKAEKAAERKEAKGKKAKVSVDLENDEFDDLVSANTGKSLADRLGNSPNLINKKAKATKKSDGLKQTKLNFKKASPKKKGKAEWETDSDEDSDMSDLDVSGETASPVKERESRRAGAAKKYNFGDDYEMGSESEDDDQELHDNDGIAEPEIRQTLSFMDDSIDETPVKKPAAKKPVVIESDSDISPVKAPKASKAKKAAKDSDSDSDVAPLPTKTAKAAKPPAQEKPSASDLFDSMMSISPPKDEPAKKSAPKEDLYELSSDEEPKPKPKKKPAAKKKDDADKPKPKPRAKKTAAPKRKAKGSDSEEDIFEEMVKKVKSDESPEVAPRSRPGRQKKVITYDVDSDDDNDSDF